MNLGESEDVLSEGVNPDHSAKCLSVLVDACCIATCELAFDHRPSIGSVTVAGLYQARSVSG
jgi:hypothetical protein